MQLGPALSEDAGLPASSVHLAATDQFATDDSLGFSDHKTSSGIFRMQILSWNVMELYLTKLQRTEALATWDRVFKGWEFL